MERIIALDMSVAAHQMHSNLVSAGIPVEHYEGYIKAQLTWMMSLEWLGSLKPDKAKIILCCDVKPYWRASYMLQPSVILSIPRKTKAEKAKLEEYRELVTKREASGEFVVSDREQTLFDDLKKVYKGGRKFPEYSFTKLKKKMYQFAGEQDWTMLASPGYEADDMMAALVQVNQQTGNEHYITLVTVDADLLGLVGTHTDWFCMYGWQPRLRRLNSPELKEWSLRRLKTDISQNPRDIWTVKAKSGDKSDNLPPGSPIEVIDLLEPPSEYIPLETDKALAGRIGNVLKSPSVKPIDGLKAADYLTQLGCQVFIKKYA